MKNAKKVAAPVFTLKHKNTCKGSASEGRTFKLTYFKREDAESMSRYLTEIGVAHKFVEPKIAA